ncbi:hypothetical protein AB3X96_40295 [Paraburkholderia sp. BR13439]|uniref:hypothetical protein n=1 Tax=unclassified Paraburkholderia TaxID=2615204 RepID=UPI0034CE3683
MSITSPLGPSLRQAILPRRALHASLASSTDNRSNTAETRNQLYVDTLMIQCVLAEPRWWPMVQAADFRTLLPSIYTHTNPYGRFDLDIGKRLPLEALSA